MWKIWRNGVGEIVSENYREYLWKYGRKFWQNLGKWGMGNGCDDVKFWGMEIRGKYCTEIQGKFQ